MTVSDQTIQQPVVPDDPAAQKQAQETFYYELIEELRRIQRELVSHDSRITAVEP